MTRQGSPDVAFAIRPNKSTGAKTTRTLQRGIPDAAVARD